LESSSNTYTIVIDNDLKGGGSFKPETGTIKLNLTVIDNFPEIASEEMFHALQKDKLGDDYSDVSKQNIETEGDLYTHYVQTTIYKGKGYSPFGHLNDDVLSEMGLYDEDVEPNSEQMSSEEYQSLYGELVQKRYEKYKDNPTAPSSYKSKPGEQQPTTLIKATREAEANEQNLAGPRLDNGDYYTD
jgi:hypothetical protein